MKNIFKIGTFSVIAGLLLWVFAFDVMIVEKETKSSCPKNTQNTQPPGIECPISDSEPDSSCLIDKLVDNIRTIFVDLYGDQLKKPHTTLVECHFDEYFDQQMRELEKTTINQDSKVSESAALLDRVPPSLSGNLGDEPPPLPGLLSRGKASALTSFYNLLMFFL